MIDLDEWIDGVNDKLDVLDNVNKESIKSMLKVIPNLNEVEIRQLMADINEIVNTKYTKKKLSSKNPLLSFPSEEESKGDFEIGTVCAGDKELYAFALTTENLRENIFVTARSGHGKTSLVFYFVGKLVYNNISFIFFDWKNDYRTLATMYPDILVVKWSDLRFNPLTNVPEGMDIKVWWRIVLDVLSHSQGLLMATPSYILQVVEELYDEKKGEITFRDLGNYLRSQHEESRKKGEYADVAENRIFNINQALDKVINVRHGFDVKDLFNKKVVIEMSPLDFGVASFLIQTLIMHEFYSRLTNNVRLNRKSTM
ncbi:MAG: DUF87 domain-containing protein, partial [Thaumarchaeota archaeon]|nr:DUF87 domain-containing protein [Nitrososphaerota archaeon]